MPIPALFTTMSTPPSLTIAVRTASVTESASRTSTGIAAAVPFPFRLATALSSRGPGLAATPTDAPAATSAVAIAAPRPLVAPVTTTLQPSRRGASPAMEPPQRRSVRCVSLQRIVRSRVSPRTRASAHDFSPVDGGPGGAYQDRPGAGRRRGSGARCCRRRSRVPGRPPAGAAGGGGSAPPARDRDRGELALGTRFLPRRGRRLVDGDRSLPRVRDRSDHGQDVDPRPRRVLEAADAQDGRLDAHARRLHPGRRVAARTPPREPLDGLPAARMARGVHGGRRGHGDRRNRAARAGEPRRALRVPQAAAER